MSRGHSQVFSYPYSFFKIAIEQAHIEFKHQSIAIATGLGLSFAQEKDAIKKFLED